MPVQAVFTDDEMISLREALSSETVHMRRHVRDMQRAIDEGEETGVITVVQENTIGARKHLRDLESLLAWAKDKTGKAGRHG